MTGRPTKTTVEYFPHDSHASDEETVTILEQNFGAEGYRFWFKLWERLAAAPGHYLDCRKNTSWAFLLAKLGVTPEVGKRILDTLIELEAIDPDLGKQRILWSQNLVDRLSYVYDKRNSKPQKPIIATETRVAGAESEVSAAESGFLAVNRIELKESEGKERKPPTPLPTAAAELPVDERVVKFAKLYSHVTGRLGIGQDAEHIKDYLNEYAEDLLESAMRKAGESKPRNFWGLVDKMLREDFGGNNGRKPRQPVSEISPSAKLRSWTTPAPKRGV